MNLTSLILKKIVIKTKMIILNIKTKNFDITHMNFKNLL